MEGLRVGYHFFVCFFTHLVALYTCYDIHCFVGEVENDFIRITAHINSGAYTYYE